VGDESRIFEVGMRAAVCRDQHCIALRACRDAGIVATSNVELARELGMRPVGTMGHEHVQRYGSDQAAFEAMRAALPGPVSYLLDTFSTVDSGIPCAFRLLAGTGRPDSVRFDSGDKETQYAVAVREAKARGIRPRFILEDGFTLGMTRHFEALRESARIPPADQFYGYGGYLVNAPWEALTRDRVSAVWKLSQSGPQATMKFGDAAEAGKRSLPGRPVLWEVHGAAGSRRVIAQDGEDLGRVDATRLTGAPAPTAWLLRPPRRRAAELSPETRRLMEQLATARAQHIAALQRQAA